MIEKRTWAIYAAILWSLIFAVMSFYWAAGGMAGVRSLGKEASMEYIYANQGIISVRSLAEKLNYSERSIRRTFQKELGVSPKELSGIIRFQSLLQELYQGTQARFANVAIKYGYYDQPHLINHFKRYYGMPPNQVFKTNSGIK